MYTMTSTQFFVCVLLARNKNTRKIVLFVPFITTHCFGKRYPTIYVDRINYITSTHGKNKRGKVRGQNK